jgi:hypothetical protein
MGAGNEKARPKEDSWGWERRDFTVEGRGNMQVIAV